MTTGEQAREQRIQELQAAWEGEAATAATEEERRQMQRILAGYGEAFLAAQTESWWDRLDADWAAALEKARQTGEQLLLTANGTLK